MTSAHPITACEWRLGPAGLDEVRIVERAQRDGSVRYAVTRGGWVANRDGEWEYEPIPSSRDEGFIERTRFGEWEDAARPMIEVIVRCVAPGCEDNDLLEVEWTTAVVEGRQVTLAGIVELPLGWTARPEPGKPWIEGQLRCPEHAPELQRLPEEEIEVSQRGAYLVARHGPTGAEAEEYASPFRSDHSQQIVRKKLAYAVEEAGGG